MAAVQAGLAQLGYPDARLIAAPRASGASGSRTLLLATAWVLAKSQLLHVLGDLQVEAEVEES